MGFKKISIFILLTLTILLLADFCFAQREMEVPLPELSSEKLPLLPDYVKYIFNFAIGITGLVAFCCLIYGGFRYIISAGNPAAMADANDRIFSGLIGLVVILGSYILLTTINPQLVFLRAEREPTPEVPEVAGVYLCKDTAGEDCYLFTKSTAGIGDLNDKVKYVKFRNPDEYEYGVVLHKDKYFRGKCAVCLSGSCQSEIAKMKSGVSSITVFIQREGNGKKGVTVYKHKEYNERNKEKQYQVFSIGEYKDFEEYRYINCEGSLNRCDLHDNISSIKVVNGYMAVLFEGANFTDRCEVFTQNDPNLRTDNYIGNDAASSLRVLPIK